MHVAHFASSVQLSMTNPASESINLCLTLKITPIENKLRFETEDDFENHFEAKFIFDRYDFVQR